MTLETDEFLAGMLPRQDIAYRRLCAGEAEPWKAIWSTRDPVSLFGAVASATGWDEVSRILGWVASRFSGLADHKLELVAAGASGDLAYAVCLEHKTAVVDGEELTYTLRVTHVYRREDGVWKIVHRHGDHPPTDQVPRPADGLPDEVVSR